MSETKQIEGKIQSIEPMDKAYIFVVNGIKFGLFKDNKQGIDGSMWNSGDEVRIGYYIKGIYNNITSINGIIDDPDKGDTGSEEDLDKANEEAAKQYHIKEMGASSKAQSPTETEIDKDIHLQVCFKMATKIAVNELADSKLTAQDFDNLVEHIGQLAESINIQFHKRKTRLKDMKNW